ncbi:MAG TPA: diaminopimelate decarboxylase [Myxococcales bacterium]|nr:diaminopimelate decarboxylase [Myxococcales bacterium]
MRHFARRRGALCCEDVSLAALAEAVGTPFYVYSRATLERHYRVVSRALAGGPHLVCYSVKACSNLAVLALLRSLGSGFDVVSGGELRRVLRVGGDPRRIVFSGVGKTEAELELALRAGIRCFNAESDEEIALLSRTAVRLRRTAPLAIRVNPDVDARTHPYIATALRESKFGVPLARARQLYREAAKLPGLRVVGVDCHLGSQLTSLRPFAAAVGRLRRLLAALERDGHRLEHVDLGGGLGVPYVGERPPSPAAWARTLRRALGDPRLTLIVEPGRVIAANAGALVTRVLYRKRSGARAFAVVDAGMNDLIRPALYGAVHELVPVGRPRRKVRLDVVGPVCESGDFLVRRALVDDLHPGELWAVMTAGAYGFSMASNYNSRPRPPEILVSGRHCFLARRRESVEDLWRGEDIPKELQA